MADRPIECTQCTRPIEVHYVETGRGQTFAIDTCGQCPILQKRLHGSSTPGTSCGLVGTDAGVCCGQCGTTLLAVRTGAPLGCAACYDVFTDALVNEIITQGYIPPWLRKIVEGKKSHPLHVGNAPAAFEEGSSAQRIASLHEALNEALKGENYEQAAWLRDQIKTLTDKKPS